MTDFCAKKESICLKDIASMPKEAHVVFMANHPSGIDPWRIWLAVRPLRRTAFVASASIARWYAAPVFRLLGFIFFPQGVVARTPFHKLLRHSQQPHSATVVFPEGSVTFNPRHCAAFSRESGKLALAIARHRSELGSTILVPVAICQQPRSLGRLMRDLALLEAALNVPRSSAEVSSRIRDCIVAFVAAEERKYRALPNGETSADRLFSLVRMTIEEAESASGQTPEWSWSLIRRLTRAISISERHARLGSWKSRCIWGRRVRILRAMRRCWALAMTIETSDETLHQLECLANCRAWPLMQLRPRAVIKFCGRIELTQALHAQPDAADALVRVARELIAEEVRTFYLEATGSLAS